MRFPKVVVAIVVLAAARGAAQDSSQLAPLQAAQQALQQAAQQAQMRAMLEQIVRQRPVQAESAARVMLRRLQLQQQTLDSLRARSADQYWQEVAQLTVQAQVLQQMGDSMRQQLMAQMFGAEARARALQRDYVQIRQNRSARPSSGNQPIFVVDGVPINEADSGRVRAIREQLQAVLERHLAAEDSMRSLEIADVERRLAQVRAETAQRRRERAVLVRQMVDEILRDARRPE